MISKKYLKSLIIRILISIVLFLALSIFTRYSNKNLLLFKNHVYDQSFNFSKVSQIYQKLFGQALPAKTATLASSNKISYTKSSSYHDGALLEGVNTIYPFKSGIVVFIGNKDNYGNTIIIEGMDGIDYWFGNITDVNIKLYDYVESDTIIGNAKDNKLYVVFMKSGKVLNYNDYL